MINNKKRSKYFRRIWRRHKDIRKKKSSINQTAKLCNVPKTTIVDTLKEKYKNPGDKDGQTALTGSKEMLVVISILELDAVGFR